MDTKIIYKVHDKDTLYEVSEAGPETVLIKMRADLSKETQENILLQTKEISQEEFEQYFKNMTILDCDPENSNVPCA